MRTAMLIAVNAAGVAKVIASPETPLQDQKAKFKELCGTIEDGNDKIVELQLWVSSGGIAKRKKWLSKAQVLAVKAAQERERIRMQAEAEAKAEVEKDRGKANDTAGSEKSPESGAE